MIYDEFKYFEDYFNKNCKELNHGCKFISFDNNIHVVENRFHIGKYNEYIFFYKRYNNHEIGKINPWTVGYSNWLSRDDELDINSKIYNLEKFKKDNLRKIFDDWYNNFFKTYHEHRELQQELPINNIKQEKRTKL